MPPLSERQRGTVDEASAHLIGVAERLDRMVELLLAVESPTALEIQMARHLQAARKHNYEARAILTILRAGKSVP